MNNPIRMTIRPHGQFFAVFKMKSEQCGGYATDMAGRRFSWFVSRAAAARKTGTYAECMDFIEQQSAQFMSDHGIPV